MKRVTIVIAVRKVPPPAPAPAPPPPPTKDILPYFRHKKILGYYKRYFGYLLILSTKGYFTKDLDILDIKYFKNMLFKNSI